jgi:hypothetical protein
MARRNDDHNTAQQHERSMAPDDDALPEMNDDTRGRADDAYESEDEFDDEDATDEEDENDEGAF